MTEAKNEGLKTSVSRSRDYSFLIPDHMFIILWIINALAVMLTAYLVPGVIVSSFWSALIAAVVIGLVNAIIRPLALLLTLPINILTLGLFTLVINALMFWLASALVPGFTVTGFWAAFIGALVFWIVSWLSNSIVKRNGAHTSPSRA